MCGVDADVVRFFDAAAVEDFLVDVAEGVEGFAFIGFVFVAPRAEVAGEEFLVFFDVVLGYLWFEGSVFGTSGVSVCLLRGRNQ